MRADCTVYLYKSIFEEETRDQSLATASIKKDGELKKNLEMTIGGIAGLGSTKAMAEVDIEKLDYQVGENIKVRIDMDNSACAKPVKSFKYKLRRNIKCIVKKGDPSLEKDEYLIEIKDGECEAKKSTVKEYNLEIPIAD